MPFITITAGQGSSDLEAGTYEMVLLSIVPKVLTVRATGEERETYEWTWGLVDDDEVEIRGLTSQNTSPKSKAVKWISALLGPDAARVGATFEVQDLIGRRALVTVEIDGESGWAKLTDVGPLPTQRRVRAQAAPQPAPAPQPTVRQQVAASPLRTPRQASYAQTAVAMPETAADMDPDLPF